MEAAAVAAVGLVRSGMRIGLGTGRTARYATQLVAHLLHDGTLRDVVAYPTSKATRRDAQAFAIPLLDEALAVELDLTIDGADEIDPDMNLIKGGGGALLREKITAQASRRLVIVADEGKVTPQLGGTRPVPVEVLRFGWQSQQRFLASFGAEVVVRPGADGGSFTTDSGNLILDCHFGPIADAAGLALVLDGRAGIVEHGLFIGLAHDVFIGGAEGVQHRTRRDG